MNQTYAVLYDLGDARLYAGYLLSCSVVFTAIGIVTMLGRGRRSLLKRGFWGGFGFLSAMFGFGVYADLPRAPVDHCLVAQAYPDLRTNMRAAYREKALTACDEAGVRILWKGAPPSRRVVDLFLP